MEPPLGIGRRSERRRDEQQRSSSGGHGTAPRAARQQGPSSGEKAGRGSGKPRPAVSKNFTKPKKMFHAMGGGVPAWRAEHPLVSGGASLAG